MAKRNEFFDQPINNPLSSTIEFWRDRLCERSDLGDAHGSGLLEFDGKDIPQRPADLRWCIICRFDNNSIFGARGNYFPMRVFPLIDPSRLGAYECPLFTHGRVEAD